MKKLSRTESLKRDQRNAVKRKSALASRKKSTLMDPGKARSGSSKKGKNWITKRQLVQRSKKARAK